MITGYDIHEDAEKTICQNNKNKYTNMNTLSKE